MNNQDELASSAQGPLALKQAEWLIQRASEAAEDAHGPLSTAVLETIAKLPADRFAAALLMALALREQFSQDRLSSFAKGLRVKVSAFCKRLKTDKPDEPAS